MAQAKGANAQVIIQEETTFGLDPVAPDAIIVPMVSCGIRMSRGQEASASLRSGRNPTRAARGNTDVGGPLVVELQAYIGTLLKATLGSVVTTGAGPYTHTFKIGSSLPSLLIEKGYSDLGHYFKYNGCKVARMSFNLTASGFQQLTFEFLGAQESVDNSSFDATPQDLGKVPFDGFSIGTIEEGGAPIANLVGIDNFSIENDLDGDGYVLGGQGVRDEIPEGLVRVSGTLKARFKDLTLYNKAVNDTESSLRFGFALGNGLGSAGNESLEFYLSELTYAPNSPVITGPKGVLVELPFTAYYDNAAAASALQITLKNTQATV